MQAARKLQRRSVRKAEGAFLAEGPTVVAEALRSGAEVLDLFLSADVDLHELEELARSAGVTPQLVAGGVMRSMSGTRSPQGAVAIVREASSSLGSLPSDAGLLLVLLSVRDPGNAGTLIRSAAAAGADAVVFAEASVDPFGPKTVRSSAGMLFHVPIVSEVTLAEVKDAAAERALVLMGADAEAATDYVDADLSRRLAVVVGNEAWGIPEEVRGELDEVVAISMPGPAESLNVGIAGSLLLFEALRQRRRRRVAGGAGVYPPER
ncbi:MAG: RNA methyltransferase [Actinobacteria bacterium]|nr:RNA methyltransferase [Actinomycetota bacterium]